MTSQEVMRYNQTVLDSLEEGDLVEFSRGVYSHWAVYIGDEEVIHLTTDDDKSALDPRHLSSCCGRCSDKARVRKDNFFRVAGKDKAKRNNSHDKKKYPLTRRQIVKNALSRLNEAGYNVIFKNCQHFATWCRYGEAISEQVEFWSWMAVGAVAAVAGVVVAAVLDSRKSKKQTQ